MKELLIEGSVQIWTEVRKRLLVTPTKFHYTFTIRELSRVFQGICQVALAPQYEVIKNCSGLKDPRMKPELFLVGLWRHECERVFSDKLISLADKKVFTGHLNRVTQRVFEQKIQGMQPKKSVQDLMKERMKGSALMSKLKPKQEPPDSALMTDFQFVIFNRDDVYDDDGELLAAAPLVYEAGPSVEAVRTRAEEKLALYNEKFPAKKMNLVLFDDALGHLLRITRIINIPGGNALLVGVGGSGKQSMTKLSAFICDYKFCQISLTKTYGDLNLREDIREMYNDTGPLGKSLAFIMTDAEVKSESFLEAINSMLATGEIPGLLSKADKDAYAI